MSALRALAKHTRALSHARAPVRAFHSPFAVLSTTSPLTSPPPPTHPQHEKQLDHALDPLSPDAPSARHYVVSAPDPAHTPYAVPSGAYPTSAPYVSYASTEPPVPPNAQFASASTGFAHPHTTARVPRNDAGVGESAAVRHRAAPGEMGARGGGYGGLGLQDARGTRPGQGGELPDVNLAPDRAETAAKFSELGVDGAWKERK